MNKKRISLLFSLLFYLVFIVNVSHASQVEHCLVKVTILDILSKNRDEVKVNLEVTEAKLIYKHGFSEEEGCERLLGPRKSISIRVFPTFWDKIFRRSKIFKKSKIFLSYERSQGWGSPVTEFWQSINEETVERYKNEALINLNQRSNYELK